MLKNFIKDTSGNFSIMMAGSFLALMGGVGLTVDYLGMTESASQLQSAVDGAAIAAAISGEDDEDKVKAMADELFEPLRSQGLIIKSDYDFSGASITVTAQTSYTPRVMGALGFGARTISASAEVPAAGGGALDIVLVLDVTGSMEHNGKIDQMQIAVNNFLNDFKDGNSDIRVSIVPFSQYVNVGAHNSAQPWVDNSQAGGTFPPFTRTLYDDDCIPAGWEEETCTRTDDGVSYQSTCQVCNGTRQFTAIGTDIVAPLKVWDGCVGSRAPNLALQADYAGTPFPAVYDDGRPSHTPYFRTEYACPDSMLPLTDNITAAQTMVGSLTTTGETYMPSGLAWGWRALDGDVPFTEASTGGERKKVLVLMTDGQNTHSRRDINSEWGNSDGRYHTASLENSPDVTIEANAVTQQLCTNIKGEDISLYTIAYELPVSADVDTTRALLQNCASDSDSYFDAQNGTALVNAFQAISKSLVDIRLIN